jgi:cell growth-regulating nucleolar protein
MTEDQKYQGALYKDKKNKKQKHSHPNDNQQHYTQDQAMAEVQTLPNNTGNMSHYAYVEDVPEDQFGWAEYEESSDDESPNGPPPEAPTPPSAAPEPHVDVFEFLVGTGQTPNASNMNLDAEPGNSLVRYEPKEKSDEYGFMDDDDEPAVEYGSGPVPAAEFVTPASKSERRKSRTSTEKKDKKRKRLHIDVPSDQVMTDAPPVLHSGLTGGINRMMRPVFPPSPDYSGGDAPEISPASPLKKSKHSKHSKRSKHASTGHSLFGMIAGSKPKSKSKTKTKSSSKTKKTSSSSKKSHKEKKPQQLIEYRPQSKDGKTDPSAGQVVLYKPRADVFLSFVDKGPESEKGVSLNRVLKRFHREREATGSELGKGKEEKELWRSLRLRQNEQGEIVLFSVE